MFDMTLFLKDLRGRCLMLSSTLFQTFTAAKRKLNLPKMRELLDKNWKRKKKKKKKKKRKITDRMIRQKGPKFACRVAVFLGEAE